MANNLQCPICEKAMAQRNGWISHCLACGYLQSHLEANGGTGIEGLMHLRQLNNEIILDRLANHFPLKNKRLLEVGCAKGWFLEAAKRRDMNITAIEPEEKNAEHSRCQGFNVLNGYFPDIVPAGKQYDIIAFNDVFEHLPDPAQAIRDIEHLLTPGGIVILNLPSSDGILFRIANLLTRCGFNTPYERLWQKGLSSPHISYFNSSNLIALATRHTSLRPLEISSLKSFTRHDLHARVITATPGFIGHALFAALWLTSFAVDRLPSDALLVFLQKPT